MSRHKFSFEIAYSVVILIGLAILLVSCAVRGNVSTVPPTLQPIAPGTLPLMVTSTVVLSQPSVPTETVKPESTPTRISIIATVMDTSLSARIIMLEEPVDGFSVVALTEDTKLSSLDGSPVELKDFQRGVQIRAIGRPGSSGALLAEQIILLSRK